MPINIEKIIKDFKNKKVGVVGDLMLDQFIWGDVERISPEAPVPVVLAQKETFAPGGAGNTANNIAALGGDVFVISQIGKDSAGETLLSTLRRKNIDTRGVFKDQSQPTIQKIRIVARSQQVVRVDKENGDRTTKDREKKIIDFITEHIKDWNALVISDYAKGLATKSLIQKIIEFTKKHNKPVIGDTKPKHAEFFKEVTIICPNQKEASEIAGTEDIEEAGKKIQKELNCNVLITQGSDGMTLFKRKGVRHFPTKAREVFDVSGAGDTVAAVLALALASGASLEEATLIANHAAGIVVGKLGTATCSQKELLESFKKR